MKIQSTHHGDTLKNSIKSEPDLSQKFRRLFKAAEQASSTRDDYDTYILCMA